MTTSRQFPPSMLAASEGEREFDPLDPGDDRLALAQLNEELQTQLAEVEMIQEALAQSEASLANAQRIAHLGNWDWNIVTNDLYWSDEIYRIFGLTPRSFPGTYPAFLNTIHPEDRPGVEEAVNTALAHGKPYSIDHRIVLPDGRHRIVHEQAEITFDPQGNPVMMCGTVQDITAFREAEVALRQSEAMVRFITDHVQDILFRYRLHPTRAFEYLSPACTAITGYSPEEHYANPDLYLERMHEEDLKRLRNWQNESLASLISFRIRRKDGRIVWLEQSQAPTRDSEGRIISIEGVIRDVSERKAMEAAVLAHRDFLELMAQIDEMALSGKSTREILLVICERLVEILRYPLVLIGMKQPDGSVGVHSHSGSAQYLAGLSLRWDETPEGQGPTGRAIRSKAPQVVRVDEPAFEAWRSRAEQAGFQACLSVPLLVEGDCIGVINFYALEAHAFDAAVIHRLQAISERISLAVLMARHQDQLYLQSAAIEAAADGIFITDDLGRIEWANSALLRLAGYTADELVGRRPVFFNSGHHGPAFYREIMETVRAKEAWEGEFVLHRRGGGVLNIHATASFVQAGESHVIFIMQDISESRKAKQKIQHMALHDPLTQLPNRNLFQSRLRQAVAHSKRSERMFAVHVVDLDHFKLINDTHGHDVGDEVLRIVSERLLSSIREGDVLARLGGDEFAVIQPNLQHFQEAEALAHKLLGVLATPVFANGYQFRFTGSAGISLFPTDDAEPEQLLKDADLALYKAKDLGRNNYQFFSPELNETAQKRLKLEGDLREALRRSEFLLHYQPRLSLRTGHVVGLEALIRWRHPERGMVPPSDFIPVAEETGLILPIGEWVLREACRQMRAWREAGLPSIRVAVNLSAVQFNQLHQNELLDLIRNVLTEFDLEPSCLELELTESMLMRQRDGVLDTLERLRALGVSLAIDDFGTGYSSLNYLSRFPIHVLKIDRSFIQQALESIRDRSLVQAVISMGHSLNLQVLAEGVETSEQLAFLVEQGCDEIQGYYFSPPVHPERVPELLDKELARA